MGEATNRNDEKLLHRPELVIASERQREMHNRAKSS